MTAALASAHSTGKIIWLASYPKSGNTWLRILLANYFSGSDSPVDINELDGGPIAGAREVFDERVGIEAADLTAAEVARLRPLVYEQLSAAATEPMFLKVHDAFTCAEDDTPIISKAATRGALYLLRNPLDVAVSFAHHSNKPLDEIVEAMTRGDFTISDSADDAPCQLSQRLLSWSGHVQSWVDEPGIDTFVLRYEDLHRDATSHFASALRSFGYPVNHEQVARAVAFSEFTSIQRQERALGFREKLPQSRAFFRHGRVGGWRDHLSPELIDRIVGAHGDVMRRFGYLDADGHLLV